MKITLEVDPKQLSEEVSDFVKTLTKEDKQALVKEVVGEYYADYRKFEEGEKALKEKEIITNLQKDDYYCKGKTEEEVRSHHRFTEARNKVQTFAEITRREISLALQAELNSQVRKFIENDPEYKTLIATAMATVKENFPAMVQAAMVQHMSGQINGIQHQLYELGNHMYERIGNIEQKLLR